MFIVTKNNPYYPSVEYFETLHVANKQRDFWVAEMESEVGTCECNITVAEVIETTEIKSDC